ncbi:MAG: hypothetical protein LBB19_01975 [Puniceicoccales bacterium]|jgi:hypothetical protein|nr:hypothetical protein [Puniceicoccales bacterium]
MCAIGGLPAVVVPGVVPGVDPGGAAAALRPGADGGVLHVGDVPRPMAAPGAGNAAATLQGTEGKSHPHINNDHVMENVDAIMEPREFDKTADAALLQHLKDQGVVNEHGEIDFTKLGLSQRQIKRAGLEGKVFIKENGQLDFNISGKCGENAVKALEGFKQAVDVFVGSQPALGAKITLQINPSNVATPSPADLDVLRRGGQIQYWPGDTYTGKIGEYEGKLQNTVKLTLDPGEKGTKDGLTVQVLDAEGEETGNTGRIPLDVVFGGREREGHKALKNGQPILPNWRNQEFFEQAQIQTESERSMPFARYHDTKNNLNDAKRIQAENNLWSGFMDYVKATSKTTVGVFNAGGAEGGAAAPAVGDADAAAAAARIEREAQLNTLYGELKAYLAKPKDVTADGLNPFIQRLQALKPEEGTPEAHLQDCLTKLKNAVANPIENVPPTLVFTLPDGLRELLSPICEGLTELKNLTGLRNEPIEIYQAIKNANADPDGAIRKGCPTAVVNAVLAEIRGLVVNAMVTTIQGADAADLSTTDQINAFGTQLAQVDLAKGSGESNRVGQALLNKLTADASPWRVMAASGDAGQIAKLQQQVAAFQNHFSNAVPDWVTNALRPAAPPPAAAAPPPPPPGAGDAASGKRLAAGDCRLLKAMHLYEADPAAVIPKATAKAQLEAMLQAYRDICAYAVTQGAQADNIKSGARAVLQGILPQELNNVQGMVERRKAQALLQIRNSTNDNFEAALQQCIDACA